MMLYMAIKQVQDLGVERAALRKKLAEVSKALEAAVVEATTLQEDSEAAIAEAAGVDRMTVRRWTGKTGQWSKAKNRPVQV